MKKIFLLILSAFVIFTFASCKLGDNNDQADENPPAFDNGDLPPSETESVKQIVLADAEIDSEALLESLKPYVNGAKLVMDDAAEADIELIIGKSERAISSTAYRRLEISLDDAEGYAGWLIYAKNGDVAVVYSSSVARRFALSALEALCKEGDIFALEDGIAAEDKFYTSDKVDEIRESEREAGFLELESIIGKAATDELRNLYMFYDKELYLWIADLYAPEVGGFYFSNSARNTIGYLPDIESTVQILQFLNVSGLLSGYGNSYAKAFEEYPEIKDALIGFAKGLQSPVDGYFYHPQWEGEQLSDSRLGRDLDFATILLSAFLEKPLYDTPNGIVGENRITGTSPASLTSKLGISTVSAVSRVLRTSNNGLPEHLRSLESFKKYVASLNVETDSYSAGNTLASQYGQIRAAGDEYVDYLIDYLNRTQRSDTGLWEDEVTFSSMNGLMKIGGIYNYYDLPIPNIDEALESTISIMKNPSLTAFSIYDEHVCSVYNPWVIIRYLLDSAKDTLGKDKVKEMRAYIISEAEELLSVTFDKVAIFKRDNGGFSYLRNPSSGTSQGAPVSVPGTLESDVNATTILSTSIVYNIFYAFGVDAVPLFCKEDGDIFFENLLSLEEIIKDPQKPVEAVTFDNFDSEENESENGIVDFPANGVSFYLGDYEMDGDGKYKWFSADVVKNPAADAPLGDLVLKTLTYTYPDEIKNVPLQPSYTKFNMGITDKGGNCHVFDADLMFKSGSATVAQIFFYSQSGNVFSLNVVAYSVGENKFIRIGENFVGLDGVKNNEIAKLVPFDRWFKLRIELYKEYSDDGTLDVIGKIYVDGKLVGECDAGDAIDGKFVDKKIVGVSIQHYRHSATELYFNNVKCEQKNKKYETVVSEEPSNNRVADFESGEYGTPYLTNYVCSGSTAVNVEDKDTLGAGFVAITEYSVVSDPKNSANKVLMAHTTGERTHAAGFTKVLVSNENPEGKVYVLETRFYLESATLTGDVTQIHFVNSSITNLVSFRIYTTAGGDTFAIHENNSDGSGTGAIVSDLPMREWVTMRIEWYQGDSADTTRAKIYIGISDGEAECVADIAAYRIVAFTSELSQVRIAHQRTNASTVYFDDISLEQTDKAYSAE